MHCPHCSSTTFTVGRDITIWQTLRIRFTDTQGHYEVEDDELHDTVEAHAFVDEAHCEACGTVTSLKALGLGKRQAERTSPASTRGML